MHNAEFTIRNAAASPVRDEKGLGRGVNPCTTGPNPMLVPLGTAECAGMGEKSDAPNGAKECVVGVTQGFTGIRMKTDVVRMKTDHGVALVTPNGLATH